MEAETFELQFTLAPEDFRGMMRAYWRLSPARRWGVLALRGIALIGAALAAFSWWESGEVVDAIFAVVLLVSPIGAPWLNRLYYDGVFRKQRLGEGPTRVKADVEGVSKSGPNGFSRFAWTKIRRVDASRKQILLWITPYQAVIVPKRAFADPADMARFLGFAMKNSAGQQF